MNKIGIVTWYDKGFNYGSTLQAFALQTYLEKQGYECELINYKPEYKIIHNIFKEILKRIYLWLFNRKVYKKWKIMGKWIKSNIKESKLILRYNKLKKYSKNYDAVICGSDQIWNNSHNKINPFYYLQFVDVEKRIAYAPSIGRNYIDDNKKEEFSKYVKEIKYLSVREEKGAELIEKFSKRNAKVVLDPTFLLDKKMWEISAKIPEKKLIDEPYIFAYFLSENEEYFAQVKNFAKEKKLKLVTVPMKYNEDELSIEASHSDFLNLIKNAKYVITDSFHGMIFSINFEKEFIIYKRFSDEKKETQNSRIYNILKKFELNDRLVTKDNLINKITKNKIDYDKVKNILQELRNDSEQYLLESIKSVIK